MYNVSILPRVQLSDSNLLLLYPCILQNCYKRKQGLYQVSKIYSLHWIEQVQTIFHSEFHSDRAYGGLRKGKIFGKPVTFRRPFTACCIYPNSLIWVPLETWNRHFMLFSKIKVVVINEFCFFFFFFTPTSLLKVLTQWI